ncbi:MAG: hypothetical protein HP058_04550, partial [Massilimaliae sp.]|nr:hypothetical protein [Massiliimalia sp.]
IHSVNPVRLKNFPIHLTEEAIREIYTKVFTKLPETEIKKFAEQGNAYLKQFEQA